LLLLLRFLRSLLGTLLLLLRTRLLLLRALLLLLRLLRRLLGTLLLLGCLLGALPLPPALCLLLRFLCLRSGLLGALLILLRTLLLLLRLLRRLLRTLLLLVTGVSSAPWRMPTSTTETATKKIVRMIFQRSERRKNLIELGLLPSSGRRGRTARSRAPRRDGRRRGRRPDDPGSRRHR